MTDEERWRAAEALRAGGDDPVLRRRQRRGWILLVTLAVVIIGGLIVVPLLFGPDVVERQRPRIPTWRGGLGLGLLAAGGALNVLAMWRLIRSQRGSGLPPEAVLTRPQRRELIGQLHGRIPVQAERVPLIRDWADRFVQLHATLTFVILGGL